MLFHMKEEVRSSILIRSFNIPGGKWDNQLGSGRKILEHLYMFIAYIMHLNLLHILKYFYNA